MYVLVLLINKLPVVSKILLDRQKIINSDLV